LQLFAPVGVVGNARALPATGRAMLKISVINEQAQTTLVVEGKVVGIWVDELQKIWDEVRNEDIRRNIVVDMMDVTLVSERGQELLRHMMAAGTVFKCCRGVHTKHVVQKLMNRFGTFSRSNEGNG
jgi:hypothetical protein